MSDAHPPWAYEKVVLHPHDPGWAATAAAERARLVEVLAPYLVDGIEHVGSTAVPGLAAKPIIDLMASVRDPAGVVDQAPAALTAEGWCYVPPELDGRPYRRFFVKPDPSGRRRLAHLHLIRAGYPEWTEQLAFRDALRRDERLAKRYEDLKRRLADRHGDDREAYTHAKGQFIAEVLRPAASGSPR